MKTNGNVRYQETVFTHWLSIIPGLLGLGIAGFGAWALASASAGWASAGWTMIGTGLFVTLVVASLAVLRITVTDGGVNVRYGFFSYSVSLGNIEYAYPDLSSGVNYGGFGVRFATIDNHRRVAYILVGASRIVLRLNRPENREFVFSTRDSRGVMQTLQELGITTA
jgi:hypothetical protein